MLKKTNNNQEIPAKAQNGMSHDLLFLLPNQFMDKGEGPYYCPECAQIVGLLEYYPDLKEHLDVRQVEFSRPRSELVSLLGKANQGCPVLILHSVPQDLPYHIRVKQANGRHFVEGAQIIAEYLAHVHGTGLPH